MFTHADTDAVNRLWNSSHFHAFLLAQFFTTSGPGDLSARVYSKVISISCSVGGGHFWLIGLRGIVAVGAGSVEYNPFNKWLALSSANFISIEVFIVLGKPHHATSATATLKALLSKPVAIRHHQEPADRQGGPMLRTQKHSKRCAIPTEPGAGKRLLGRVRPVGRENLHSRGRVPDPATGQVPEPGDTALRAVVQLHKRRTHRHTGHTGRQLLTKQEPDATAAGNNDNRMRN
jgi:hypothetical protein